MRRMIFMFLLAVAVFATGCGNEDAKKLQEPQKTEDEQDGGNTVVENTDQGDNVSEQDTLSNDDGSDSLSVYMVSIKEQSDSIKVSLKNDALTQHDMNIKSEELYKLWDDALNYLWGELKSKLPEEEFAKLLNEQRVWIAEKEQTVEDAGKEFEGGSMYPLIVNSESAKITEERVNELYEMLK